MNERSDGDRNGRRSAAPDLPFYAGAPVSITGKGWIVTVAAALVAFAALTLAPPGIFSGVFSILPAIVFTGLPLAALSVVSGGYAHALFRRYGAKAFGISLLFSILTIGASFAMALIVRTFSPMQANAVGDVLSTIGTLDFLLFLVRTFIQLIGEEVITVVVLLAVLWLCHARLGLGRRSSLYISVAVSTIWFASLHLPTYGWNFAQCFAVIGTARLVLTWAYLRTRNLWVSVGAHIMNDWSIFAVTFAGSHLPIGT